MKIDNIFLFLLFSLFAFSANGERRVVSTATYQSYYYGNNCTEQIYEYETVDVQPKFPGGQRGLINFINETREYPTQAYENGIQGRVVCSFVICPNGTVKDVIVIKGCDELLDQEALRILEKMPQWKAGKIDGEKVPVRYVLPIAFRL